MCKKIQALIPENFHFCANFSEILPDSLISEYFLIVQAALRLDPQECRLTKAMASQKAIELQELLIGVLTQ